MRALTGSLVWSIPMADTRLNGLALAPSGSAVYVVGERIKTPPGGVYVRLQSGNGGPPFYPADPFVTALNPANGTLRWALNRTDSFW